jgi:tetratricopeptide (TPR) repeat protein
MRVRELQRTTQAARDAWRLEALLSEASAHLEAQRLVEARVAIDFIVAARPDSAAALELRERLDRTVAEEERRRDWARRFGAAMNRARAELERGALQQASAAIDEALSLNPENSGAVTLHQRIAASLAAEQEQLRREQEARLQKREARVASARTALAGDDLTSAEAVLGEAEQLGAGEDLARLRIEIDARRQALQRAADRVRAGEARLEQGDLETASGLVDEALAIKRDLPHATALRARVDRAIEERRQRHAWLHARFDSGKEALRQEQFDVALECLEQVRQAEPAWPGVSNLIAEAGRRKAADIERRRREEELARLLRQATQAHARQDLEAARAEVGAMLRLDRAFAPALALSGQIEEALEARRAEEARRKAAEERKRRFEQMARARDAFSAGRVDEALSMLEPLANSAQREPGFNELLQQVRAEHERLEAERRRLRERAQRISAALERARQQLDSGAYGPARAAADEALALDPEHNEALDMGQRIAAAVERHVDGLIQAAGAQVAKERHQRGIEILERAGLNHARLDAELERIRKAADALALERRVDEVLARARGRFRKRSPADVLEVLEQSGLQHPRVAQEMQAARQAIAEAAAREAEAARAREEQARQEALRAEQERAARVRAEQERVEKARAEKAAAEQAATARAAEKARADDVRAQKASAEAATKAKASPAGQPARAQWQKLAALAVAAILVLVVGVLAARRFWPSSPDQTQSTPPVTPAPNANLPSSATGNLSPSSSNAGATDAPPTAPVPAEPAATTSTPAERAKSLASRILQLAGQPDRQRALAAAVEANTQFGNEPIVRDALARLTRTARADAERSRANARKVDAHEQDAAGFAAADGTFLTAQRESQRGRTLDAVGLYWEAEELFAQVAARATTAQAQPPPTLLPPAATRPAPEPQPAGTRADASRTPEPAPPSPPPAAPPSTTPPASQTPVQTQPVQPEAQPFDEKAVRSALSAYAAGFASRNVNDIVRVFPTLPENERSALAQAFKEATQYDLNLECGRIEPVAPNSAIATCVARRSIRFRGGRTVNPDAATLNFRLERRGGSWVIATQLR